MKKFKVLVLMLWVLWLQMNQVSAQCAMCKEKAKDAGSAALGLNAGIVLLMTVPYILLFIAFRKQIIQLYKEFRNKKVKA